MKSADTNAGVPDAGWRAVGMGSLITWRCMGCDKNRLTLGSKGSGLMKRCEPCLVARAQRRAAARVAAGG